MHVAVAKMTLSETCFRIKSHRWDMSPFCTEHIHWQNFRPWTKVKCKADFQHGAFCLRRGFRRVIQTLERGYPGHGPFTPLDDQTQFIGCASTSVTIAIHHCGHPALPVVARHLDQIYLGSCIDMTGVDMGCGYSSFAASCCARVGIPHRTGRTMPHFRIVQLRRGQSLYQGLSCLEATQTSRSSCRRSCQSPVLTSGCQGFHRQGHSQGHLRDWHAWHVHCQNAQSRAASKNDFWMLLIRALESQWSCSTNVMEWLYTSILWVILWSSLFLPRRWAANEGSTLLSKLRSTPMTMAAKMRERVSGAYETAVGSFEP